MRWSSLSKVLAALVGAALVAALAAAATKDAAATDAEREPAFCRSADVEHVVREFVNAFNRGDARALPFSWVRIRYQWYAVSTAGRGGALRTHVEYTRRGLLRYFAERHRRDERLELTRFRYVGFSAAWGHFAFTVRRKAADLHGGRWAPYVGMGAVSCLKRPTGLASWSMAPAR